MLRQEACPAEPQCRVEVLEGATSAVVARPVQAATADVRSSREVQVSKDRVMLVKRMPAGRISLLPRSRTITMHIETQGNISGLLANSDLSMCSNQFRDRLPNTRGIIYENVPPDTSVRITDSIRKIDKKRYRGWANLTEVVFSERSRVEIIKELEFCDCVSLQSITISASVLTLCEACFKGCCGLSTVQFAEKSALGLISKHAFFGCKSLRSIKIPAGVKRIGIRAFKWCASLSDVKFEDNSMLQLIDEEAFWGCAITVITIPASVLGIGQMCFAMCPNLKEIIFAPGSQLRALGKIAFGVLPLKITLYDSWLSSALEDYTRSTSGINQHSFAQIVSEEEDSSETE